MVAGGHAGVSRSRYAVGFFTARVVAVGGLLWASSLMATEAPSGAQCVAEMLLFSGFDRLSPGIDNKKYRIINNKY